METNEQPSSSATSEAGQTPVQRLSLGPIHVTVWRNTSREGRDFYTTRIERRYTTATNEWRTTNSFPKGSLPILIDLLGKAKAHIDELESGR